MDSRSNLLRSRDATSSGSSQSVNGSPLYTYSFDVNHAFTYDAAGREINDAARYCSITASNDPGTPPSQVPILNSPRTYDAENHITGQTVPAYYEPSSTQCWTGADPTFANTEVHRYTWGPDAHLAQMSVTAANRTQTSTLGWDGDDLLYTASGNSIASIAIEKLGILASSTTGNANTFSIYDRDWSGGLANVHEAGGFSAVSVLNLKIPDCTQIAPRSMPPPPGGFPGPGFPTPTPSPTSNPKTPQIQPASHAACAQGAAAGGPSDPNFTPMIMGYPSIGALREDGYSDGINTFQGVRAYDAAMNQWTTPDAYAGDVHDPMSQKPYMWNGNNAVAYGDPSGYEIGPAYHADWKELGGHASNAPIKVSLGIFVSGEAAVGPWVGALSVTAGNGGVHIHGSTGGGFAVGSPGIPNVPGGVRPGANPFETLGVNVLTGSRAAMRAGVATLAKSFVQVNVSVGIVAGSQRTAAAAYNSLSTSAMVCAEACLGIQKGKGSVAVSGGAGWGVSWNQMNTSSWPK